MIRRAVLEDADAIAELEALLFDNSMSPSTVERELQAGEGYVIGSPIRAYALVRHDSGVVDLTRLAVCPDWQGKGLGRVLLQHVLDSYKRPTLLVVLKTNTRALCMYRRAGFRIVGHFTEADAWAMRREPA